MSSTRAKEEMISDKGLLYENDKTWDLCYISEDERPVSLQLFGGNIEEITKAAKLINQRCNCDIIDILDNKYFK